MKKNLSKFLENFGYKIHKIKDKDYFPKEANQKEIKLIKEVLNLEKKKNKNKLTMISPQCLWAAISATKYVLENNIEGDIVECGVWRGGCSIAMAHILELYKSEKKVWMFDTFAGMTKPTSVDLHQETQKSPLSKFLKLQRSHSNDWCYASLSEVRSNISEFGLLDRTLQIEGDVLKTLDSNDNLPLNISLLRLDTDWYESTKKELEILYPKLTKYGVMLIDDYGHWAGSKKAFDEYFLKNKEIKGNPLLWVTDYAGRGLIKT